MNTLLSFLLFSSIAWGHIIGCSIYTSFVNQGYAGSQQKYHISDTSWGAGFGFAWGAAVTGFVASLACGNLVKRTNANGELKTHDCNA